MACRHAALLFCRIRWGAELRFGIGMRDIFCEAGYRRSASGFILNPIHAVKRAPRRRPSHLRGKTGDCFEADGGSRFPGVTQGDFNAIGITRNSDVHGVVRRCQSVKNLLACRQGCCLQICHVLSFQPRGIGQVTYSTPSRSSEARVGINFHMKLSNLSGHGFRLVKHRRLPCIPGNSRDRQSRGGPCTVLCKWCSISHTSTRARFCHRWNKPPDCAWAPPKKTVPEECWWQQVKTHAERPVAQRRQFPFQFPSNRLL